MTYRVMILEDDPFIALDIEGVMEDAGYDIVGPLASAPEALKVLKSDEKRQPDLALLDFYVSGGTTEHVARELQRKGVPFLFLTGNAKDVRECLSDQDPLILSKPVEVDQIVKGVETLLAA